jgi:cell wall assembly regulator SMI1
MNYMTQENLLRWERLEAQLANNQPEVLKSLRAPATLSDILAVEMEMGLEFPEDVRNAYLRHDGCEMSRDDTPEPVLLPPDCPWLPLAKVLEMWRYTGSTFAEEDLAEMLEDYEDVVHSDGSDQVRPGPQPNWIPIGRSFSGVEVYIDLFPGPAGTIGQLIRHDPGFGARVIANGFGDYLDRLTAAISSGSGGWKNGKIVL